TFKCIADSAKLAHTILEATDFMFGGDGNDTMYGSGGTDIGSIIDLAGGDFCNFGTNNAGSGSGDEGHFGKGDWILGNLMLGGPGNDTMVGGNGIDVMLGQAGNDTMDGDDNIDIMLGGDGEDEMEGGDGGVLFTVKFILYGVPVEVEVRLGNLMFGGNDN